MLWFSLWRFLASGKRCVVVVVPATCNTFNYTHQNAPFIGGSGGLRQRAPLTPSNPALYAASRLIVFLLLFVWSRIFTVCCINCLARRCPTTQVYVSELQINHFVAIEIVCVIFKFFLIFFPHECCFCNAFVTDLKVWTVGRNVEGAIIYWHVANVLTMRHLRFMHVILTYLHTYLHTYIHIHT